MCAHPFTYQQQLVSYADDSEWMCTIRFDDSHDPGFALVWCLLCLLDYSDLSCMSSKPCDTSMSYQQPFFLMLMAVYGRAHGFHGSHELGFAALLFFVFYDSHQ
jgi:hypothetical protein